MYKQIIEQENLLCNETELKDKINEIAIPENQLDFEHSIHSFNEKYNGNTIENKTGNPDAKYYVLIEVNNNYVYLQPFGAENGEPLLDDNIDSAIEYHINRITLQHNENYKIQEAVNYFKTDEDFLLKAKISKLTNKLQSAVLQTCKDNQFYSIESMRSHSTNANSLLQPIAIKLNAWETAQNNHFITKLDEINTGTLDVDVVVFADEFVEFVEADW